jgi:aspartate carbamoyltransferase
MAKDETFADTIRMLQNNSDCIVIRHSDPSKLSEAAQAADRVGIINAGNGSDEHPTQAILDLYTLRNVKGKTNKLRGLIMGDLFYGRTAHSLVKGLAIYEGNEVFLQSPESLRLDPAIIAAARDRGLKVHEVGSLNEVPKDLDFWYNTRMQRERFYDSDGRFQEDKFQKAKREQIIVTLDVLDKHASEHTVLMHPLPRTQEQPVEVDSDPRAIYLEEQAQSGIHARMGIVYANLLGFPRPVYRLRQSA